MSQFIVLLARKGFNLLKSIKFIILFVFFQINVNNAYSLTPYSTKELEELEKEFVQQINQSDSIERNPLAIQYINHLGKQLARFGQIKSTYFFIVKSPEINAFAGPGGYIGINTALILATENESELAAVMAHELAHVRLHHLYRMIEHEKQMHIPMLASLLAAAALGMINPTLGTGVMMASLSGFSQDNINFTRSNEKEADRIGINMLIRAGFNPRAMANFFKKMQQSSRYYYTANIPAILRTHPLDEDRIAEADNRSLHLAVKQHQSNLNYHLFKELIRTSTASNPKQLIDYYEHQCIKHNPQIACQYGYAMTLLSLNLFKEAGERLKPLLANDNGNLFFQIAMAKAETGYKDYNASIKRLHELQLNYPENYAAIMAYSEGLLAAGSPEKAVSLLLKGSRLFKTDLTLCEELAQAQSKAHQNAYAYFTQSKCQLLQGRKRDALRKLQLVKSMTKNDPYLYARAEAMIEETKFLISD